MTVVVAYIGDGSTPISASRCKSIARAIPAHDVFVYGGDVYNSGTTAEYTGTDSFNDTYGDNALNVSPQGQNLIAKMAHTVANHEYRTVNATTLKVDTFDTYWTSGSPARNASNYVAVDNTKTDPTAAYPGMTSADAQKRAAAQWAHLKSVDIQGWRLLFIDTALSGTDEGSFPTAGNYYNAVQALVNGAAHRKLIVFAHMARWSSGVSHTDAQQANIDPLWQMVAPKAIAWVAGHNHHYERQFARTADGSVASAQSRGCVPITCGAGGAGLNGFVATYATAAALAYRDATKFGFLKLTLGVNSATIAWNAMGTDGLGTPTVEDTVTLNSVPAPQNISVTNATVGGGVVNWSATKTQTWASLVPASGASPGTIAVDVDPAGLAPGTYNDAVTVTSPETTNDPLTVAVQLVVTGAIIGSLGLVTTTATAQPLGEGKRKVLGLVTTTTTALNLGKAKTLGRATETDSALPFAGRHTAALGLATSTSSASAIGEDKRRTLGLVTTTATAQAITRRQDRALGQATTTSTALALGTRRKTKALGLVTSVVSASALGRSASAIAGVTTTTTAAQLQRARTLGLAVSSVSAQGLARHTRALTGAVSTQTAQSLGRGQARALGLAASTASATPLGRAKATPLGRTVETDTAGQVVTGGLNAQTGLVTSVHTALALGVAKRRSLGPVTSTATAQPLGRRHARALGLVTATASAQALGRTHRRSLGFISTSHSAWAVGRPGTRTLGYAEQQATALPLTRAAQQAQLGLVTSTHTARAITKARMLSTVTTTAQAMPLRSGRAKAIAPATTTASAAPLTKRRSRPIGFAFAVNTAATLGRARALAVGRTVEADTAVALQPDQAAPIGLVVQVLTAAELRYVQQRVASQVTTIHTALPLGLFLDRARAARVRLFDSQVSYIRVSDD